MLNLSFEKIRKSERTKKNQTRDRRKIEFFPHLKCNFISWMGIYHRFSEAVNKKLICAIMQVAV
jgi:hypothetical protein